MGFRKGRLVSPEKFNKITKVTVIALVILCIIYWSFVYHLGMQQYQKALNIAADPVAIQADLSVEDRLAFAGKHTKQHNYQTYDFDIEWFASTKGAKVFHALLEQYPEKFDAEAIVQLAKNTGMKYIILTAKHHDGFAMFNSKVTNYNIVDFTPYKKDILKELAEACKKHNMKLGLYYSTPDWHFNGSNQERNPDDGKLSVFGKVSKENEDSLRLHSERDHTFRYVVCAICSCSYTNYEEGVDTDEDLKGKLLGHIKKHHKEEIRAERKHLYR